MGKTTRVLVPRHGPVVRITHWINVLALILLLMSGLQIFNAHPALYWGHKSTFAQPWLSIRMVETPDGPRGVTTVGDRFADTTGLLGWTGLEGDRRNQAFPGWATIPSWRDLASGRRWHFFFAWVFVLNGVIYLLSALLGGHLRRNLLPTGAELRPRHLLAEVAAHARLKFPKGEAARRYNVLQKSSYLAVVLLLLPLMLFTGLCMSPGVNAAVPWLIDLFGGRQGARSVHFISAGLIVLFVVAHVAMVLASGAWNNIRSMITGRYAIEIEERRP
ncbi:cytochrome b/b6 domain-containing protein [Phenylobacterium sp.]|uniref:cytochrome b/b6 domain-containing protein n=1 Tax=Phenylobacterium sp. TaxID=1871053 RepID=UPI002810D6BD|nr:cytochrome b/b6 domain-containing protein [Phenylobacterium sp.]